jgi:hypothetical protein
VPATLLLQRSIQLLNTARLVCWVLLLGTLLKLPVSWHCGCRQLLSQCLQLLLLLLLLLVMLCCHRLLVIEAPATAANTEQCQLRRLTLQAKWPDSTVSCSVQYKGRLTEATAQVLTDSRDALPRLLLHSSVSKPGTLCATCCLTTLQYEVGCARI